MKERRLLRRYRAGCSSCSLRLASVFVLATLVTAGAALPSEAREPVRSLKEFRQEGVVVQQWDLSCGAAALATILNYQHGDPVSEREVAVALMRRPDYVADPELVRRRLGFSLLDLKRFVDARGYEGKGYGGLQLVDIDARAPIIVPINTHGYSHFVVYRGRLGDRVLLADPAFGNRTMTVARFKRAWLDVPGLGHVGFAVERRDGRPTPNRLAPRAGEFTMLR
jgi:uncharacterized protein